MCRAANTPSTMAQQKAATMPKLMNTMAATSWKQRQEQLGRGGTLQRPPAQVPSPRGAPQHLPGVLAWNTAAALQGPHPEPHGNSIGSLPRTPRHLPGPRLEPRGSSVGSSPPTMAAGDPPRWPGCPPQARPTRSLACFMGSGGAGTQGAVIPAHSLVDKPGPPRAWQFLAVSNSATKTLIAFHRKAWAQTQVFLQDGLWGPRGHRCQGIQWAPPHARTQGMSGPSAPQPDARP